VNEDDRTFHHPLYDFMARMPGLDVATTTVDKLMTWGQTGALWIFPMATSCCGIEFMAAAASRVDLDRMGSIVRGTPRQSDVMVVAGTITVKMAPRVKKLWDQMPEPKWCIAMGSCAISGDFYRDIYSVVPGIDTFMPVDVYIPGCPPNPEELMHGLMRLQEKIRAVRAGTFREQDRRPEESPGHMRHPSIPRIIDRERPPELSEMQTMSAGSLGLSAEMNLVELRRSKAGVALDLWNSEHDKAKAEAAAPAKKPAPAKAEAKPAPKAEPKPEAAAAEAKVEAKPEPKVEAKPEPKVEPALEPVEAKVEPQPEAKPGLRTRETKREIPAAKLVADAMAVKKEAKPEVVEPSATEPEPEMPQRIAVTTLLETPRAKNATKPEPEKK
jgi:NADH-quinone oxidoreductase subunit B